MCARLRRDEGQLTLRSQDKDEDYYMQFHIVVCGLDSIDARRWINSTLVNMVDEENPESLKPLIDGGTEGTLSDNPACLPTDRLSRRWTACTFFTVAPAHARRLRRPGSCHLADAERLLRMRHEPAHAADGLPDLHDRQHAPPAGALHRVGERARVASRLRRCVDTCSRSGDPRADKKLDNDDPDHIQWLYDQASARAAHYKIEGVTWSLTQGVVKSASSAQIDNADSADIIRALLRPTRAL